MSNPFIGEIRLFGGNFAPQGWAFCDGSVQSIAQNDALFALIGTTYGGDGQQTFNLPDLRGRVPVNQGQGPGLSNYVIGQLSGVNNVTLTSAQMPAHNHSLNASTANATANTSAGNVLAAPAANQGVTYGAYFNGVPGAQRPLAANAIGTLNGGQPHQNQMPYLGISYIISLFGIFPSQN